MRQGEGFRRVKTAIRVLVEEGEDVREQPGALRREVQVWIRVRVLFHLEIGRERGEHQVGGTEGGRVLRAGHVPALPLRL
eukprot:12483444-Alexandrium_andersonii.AAC.1